MVVKEFSAGVAHFGAESLFRLDMCFPAGSTDQTVLIKFISGAGGRSGHVSRLPPIPALSPQSGERVRDKGFN